MKSEQTAFEFTWTDAWVLTSLYSSHRNGVQIDLPALLRLGEDLNFYTFKYDALNESLAKLIRNGIVQVRDDHVFYTQLGKQLIAKARFRPGGWFSRVDITLKVLNSNETGTDEGCSALKTPVITQTSYDTAYDNYLGQSAQPIQYTPLVIQEPDK